MPSCQPLLLKRACAIIRLALGAQASEFEMPQAADEQLGVRYACIYVRHLFFVIVYTHLHTSVCTCEKMQHSYVNIRPSIHPYIHPSIHPSIHAPPHPPTQPAIHPSIHPLSMHLPIDTHVHTHIHTCMHTYIHAYRLHACIHTHNTCAMHACHSPQPLLKPMR